MATTEEIRRTNLALLRAEAGGGRALAEITGISESQLSQWINGSADSKTGKPRGMRSDSARRIEAAMKRADGWLDHPHEIPVAHELSYQAVTTPPITDWEVVVSLETMPALPTDLMVEMPDDALAARGLAKGERVWFKAASKAQPRNVVIVEANGRRYIRRYAEDAQGPFAQALDDAYPSFRDFRVVAVMHMRPQDSI